jgi:hypothetical protein
MQQGIDPRQTYRVYNLDKEEITLTGKGTDPKWARAAVLTDFLYPWEDDAPTGTTFKALHNTNWLYGLFNVRTENLIVYRVHNEKSAILLSDRVEIFLKKDDRLSPYYCLEIDPAGRVYDYKAQYHRVFNTDWSWPPDQLHIKTSMSQEGYTVELAIHKDSLLALGVLQSNSIAAGLYRAACTDIRHNKATMKWISWVKPDSTEPDFHIASSFGTLLLNS